ncbi:MAG: thioredoxin-dependent thiol peroxidase [Hyphomicrobiaceae bacterium]
MAMADVGEKAPAFKLQSDNDETVSQNSLRGDAFVLYFYPKDDTSGCTKEAIAFTELSKAFDDIGVRVLGVSPDSVPSHQKFKAKHDLGITLLADNEHELAEKFGVWVEKSMYGRNYMGVERSTFLIDAKGKIVEVWRKVKVPGHADAVLMAATELLS